jgi:MFS family permease
VLSIALPLQVYELTGSTLATGGVVAASVTARLVFGAVAGVYVDRWDRRRTLLVGNLALAATVAPLAVVTTESRIWIVYVVAFLESVVVQFVSPAESALLPQLVPDDELPAANGLNALNNNLARLIGPVLGGFAATLGIGAVVGLDVASFLVAAALVGAVAGAYRADRQEEHHVLRELVDGLRVIRRTYVAAVLISLVFMTSIGEGVMGALFAPFVVDALGGGAAELGWTMAAQAVGGIAGGLVAGRVASGLTPARVVPVALTLFGLVDLAIFNYPRWFEGIGPVLLMFAIVGVPGAFGFAAVMTILQTSVADQYRGRLFAVLGVLAAAGALVGSTVGGALGGRLGVVNLLTIQGAGYVVAGLAAGALLRRVTASPAGRADPEPIG